MKRGIVKAAVVLAVMVTVAAAVIADGSQPPRPDVQGMTATGR